MQLIGHFVLRSLPVIRFHLLSISAVLMFSLPVQSQTYQWAKRMGGFGTYQAMGVTSDAHGNIYTTGIFKNTADFDPGPGTYNLTTAGDYDVFISKLDANGNFVWAKKTGGPGTSMDDYGWAITSDVKGNIYATGSFKGTSDFDPGPGTFPLTSMGDADIYVLKLDSNGSFLWAAQAGGSDLQFATSIAVDTNGFVYTTGSFSGITDFDPGAASYDLTSVDNSEDMFVSKLDRDGHFVWARAIGDSLPEATYGIAVDPGGNVYTTGRFYRSVDFDPGAGTYLLTATAPTDIFISKLDSGGRFVWAKQMAGSVSSGFYNEGRAIKFYDGCVYTIGTFKDTVDFDPGAAYYPLMVSATSTSDMFISKLGSDGHFVWAKRIGGTKASICRSMDMDADGNIYTTGGLYGTTDFDPGAGSFLLTSIANSFDIFISRLDSSGQFVWARRMGGNPEESSYAITVDAARNVVIAGWFKGTADFDPPAAANLTASGSSDIFVAKYRQCTTSSTQTVRACRSFVSPGHHRVWTISGTYADTLPNAQGCDSIITFHLTVNHADTVISSTQTVTACQSYVSPGNHRVWTISGTYADTLPNAQGCDSIITFHLTVNHVDTAIIQTGHMLTSAAQGAGYQWLDCSHAYAPLNGETGRSFTPSADGSYAVRVTENGCTDTSSCFTTSFTGIEKSMVTGNITIYPNPANDVVHIQLGEQPALTEVTITDLLGQIVMQEQYKDAAAFQLEMKGEPGIYFLKISSGSKVTVVKMVKQ